MTDRPEAGAAGPAAAWHAMPAADALAALRSTRAGLSSAGADARLATHGPNRLPEPPRRPDWRRFLDQFANLLIGVLLGAATVTAALGEWADAVVILAVVLVNAVIGFVQEGRAEQALAAIGRLLDPRAQVRRDGRRQQIPAERLVPGDIVLLEAGDRVPADCRLLRAHGLKIEEAALTGESVPADKSTAAVAAEAPLGDREGMAFSGMLVVAGQGEGLVVATGGATEIGRISRLLSAVSAPTTPLLRQMDGFARGVTLVILGVAAVMFAFAVLVRGWQVADAFLAMVAIAVAAIPEGLPAVLTITLAIGVTRMARRNALIRRLPAVETLGAVSVICSDKTGTLTRNEMSVVAVAAQSGAKDSAAQSGARDRAAPGGAVPTEVAVMGEGYAPAGQVAPGLDAAHLAAAARVAALCNDAAITLRGGAWTPEGDPMEAALLAFAHRAGLDAEAVRAAHPRLDAIPFDAAHRWMATLHGEGAARFACVKGAPEAVLAMCGPDGAALLPQVEALAARGMRVLALAEARLPEATEALSPGLLAGRLGRPLLVGLIDPPRAEARDAIAECRAAGIRVVMITGDHAATAAAIARDLGLSERPHVLTGAALDSLDATGFADAAREVDVFARTSPEHKLRLVEALQAAGAIVAMTGDGVNDSPALKRADIGVAMGRGGTVAAQEASAMVLADDNFASIVAAVKEGRTVHDNLTKVIGWTLPTNGEGIAIIVALLLGLSLPMTPIQVLWINVVTAVTLGVALAFEPAEPGVMSRRPRAPGEPLIDRYLAWRIVFSSFLFAALAFAVFFHLLGSGADEATARTAAVNTIVALEVFYLFSVRMLHGGSLGWRQAAGTPAVLVAVGLVVLLQLGFTYAPPLQAMFGTAALTAGELALCVGAGVALFVVMEAEKWLVRRLSRR